MGTWDDLTFRPSDGVLRGLAVDGPAELAPVQTLQAIRLPGLRIAGVSVRDRYGFGQDATQYRFSGDLEEDEPQLDGVRFVFFDETVDVSLPAFEGLMVRFFDRMAAHAVTTGDPVLQEAWWPEFLEAVHTVRGRT